MSRSHRCRTVACAILVAAVGYFVSKPAMGRRTEELIANAGPFDFPAVRAMEADRQQ